MNTATVLRMYYLGSYLYWKKKRRKFYRIAPVAKSGWRQSRLLWMQGGGGGRGISQSAISEPTLEPHCRDSGGGCTPAAARQVDVLIRR